MNHLFVHSSNRICLRNQVTHKKMIFGYFGRTFIKEILLIEKEIDLVCKYFLKLNFFLLETYD